MTALYDTIGQGYRRLRRPDPRIAQAIFDALGDARHVVNVGAGTGSYEPYDRHVVAIEPSLTMIRQRPPGAAPVVQASATALPLHDRSFDAALAVLTIHHWGDITRGLRELRRVARRRVVILTWDPAAPGFWLDDYFPEILQVDRPIFPALDLYQRELGPTVVQEIQIPHDCSDGFLGAYWRRPAAFLDPEVRSAISSFAKLNEVEAGLTRLENDLACGEWQSRNGSLCSRTSLDLGYRLVIAG